MRRFPTALLAPAALAAAFLPVVATAAPADAAVILLPPRIVAPAIGIGHGAPQRPPTACGPRVTGAPSGLTVRVQPLRGKVTTTWWMPNDPDVAQLSVALVPQALRPGKQPPIAWRAVAAGAACRWHSASFSGLQKGATYDVWIDVRLKRHDGHRGLLDRTVGRSGVFVAP